MDAPQTTENSQRNKEDAVRAVYAYAAGLMRQGLGVEKIKSALVEKGLDQESASVVVEQLWEARGRARRQAARKNMLYGALWCIGGILVTVFTFSAASHSGGTYIVAWGAIIFGAIQFFRGLSQAS